MPISSTRRAPVERAVISTKRATSLSAIGTRCSAAYSSISATSPVLSGVRRSRYSACSGLMIASIRAFKFVPPVPLLEEPAYDCATLALRHGRDLMVNVRAERDEHPRLPPDGYAYVPTARVFQKAVERERAALVFARYVVRRLVVEEDDGRDSPPPDLVGRVPILRQVSVGLEEVAGLVDEEGRLLTVFDFDAESARELFAPIEQLLSDGG